MNDICNVVRDNTHDFFPVLLGTHVEWILYQLYDNGVVCKWLANC